MLLAELICSDEGCEFTLVAVGALAELELLVCHDCDCCLQVASLSAHEAARLEERFELRAA